MTQAEFSLHEMMANFNPASELQRKKFAQDALSRSTDEAREEEQLLIEVRRIVARQQKLNQDRQGLVSPARFPTNRARHYKFQVQCWPVDTSAKSRNRRQIKEA